jgi:hypothetical protein
LGFAASAAASPVSSVPLKAKEAVTKTEQNPLKPLRKPPALYGSCLTRVRGQRRSRIFAQIFLPVFGTNVTSGIGGYTATVNDNS